jgi:hypothetical protein
MLRTGSAAVTVLALAALAAPGCQSVTLDLGPEDPGDPTCPEVVHGADLRAVDFGHTAGGDCLRHFTQTAADVDQLTTDLARDVGAACDQLATAGGVPVSANPGVLARCDAAAAAIASAPPYAALSPFTLHRVAAGACTPAPALPCAACGAPCSEEDSSFVRATCTLPELEVVLAGPLPTDPAARAALAALQKSLPVVLGAVDARGDAFVAKLRAIDAGVWRVAQDGRLFVDGRYDVRGVICMSQSSRLINEEALTTYRALSDAASRLRVVAPEAR